MTEMTDQNNVPDRLPKTVTDTIRWMDKEWLPQVMADLPEPTRAIIDVYVQMELMLRQPENYDWQAEMAALRDQYRETQPVIAAFFANMLAAMRGEDLPALKQSDREKQNLTAGEKDFNKIAAFPIKKPRLPAPRMNCMLEYYDDIGRPVREFRRNPQDFKLFMNSLIRRGKIATLWADGQQIGGVECVGVKQNGGLVRRWRGKIGGYIFYARTTHNNNPPQPCA